jgi:hypothetical protein
MRIRVLKIRKTRKATYLTQNYHSFSCGNNHWQIDNSSAGEYSADDAWDFKELEEAITKGYF